MYLLLIVVYFAWMWAEMQTTCTLAAVQKKGHWNHISRDMWLQYPFYKIFQIATTCFSPIYTFCEDTLGEGKAFFKCFPFFYEYQKEKYYIISGQFSLDFLYWKWLKWNISVYNYQHVLRHNKDLKCNPVLSFHNLHVFFSVKGNQK